MEPAALARIAEAVPFPEPEGADAHGLLAWGGDLRPERLLAAYARGIFPWYDEDPILWFSPDPRMVLRPSELHVNRTLAKNLRRGLYEVRFDTCFEQVIAHCSEVPRPGQDGTWITDDMIEGYTELFRLGFAHSVESFEGNQLVGGMYGISLGAAFFGESMFSLRTDASKVAFVTLVRLLERWEFRFLDCQVHTDLTESLGATERPRSEFLAALRQALALPTRRGRWTLS
jgi:leucyl/phenylalanyl-tRNA--protein transferase